jgi:tRNA(Arg) A34 adenosine deaminase TadA
MRTAFMRQAVALGLHGMRIGEGGPFGAVVVKRGRVFAAGWNRTVATNDPTAHAEIVAIRRACKRLGRIDLSGATIYASGEPCWTCSSAIRGARLSRVVFAMPSPWATGGYTSAFPILSVAGVAGTAPPPVVVGGVLEDRVRTLFAELNWPPPDR